MCENNIKQPLTARHWALVFAALVHAQLPAPLAPAKAEAVPTPRAPLPALTWNPEEFKADHRDLLGLGATSSKRIQQIVCRKGPVRGEG